MSGNGRRFEHAARCQGWPGPMQYRECKMVWDLQGAGAMLGQCPRVEPAHKLPSGATATWAPSIVPLNLFWLGKKFLYRRKISSICSEFQLPGQFREEKINPKSKEKTPAPKFRRSWVLRLFHIGLKNRETSALPRGTRAFEFVSEEWQLQDKDVYGLFGSLVFTLCITL